MPLLPQFPLSIVVFPGEKLNLHIFEPRYRQLIKDSKDNQTTFGVPTFMNGNLCDFGTEVTLVEISTIHDDGRMDIRTKGGRQYKLSAFKNLIPDKLYAGAEVTWLEDAEQGTGDLAQATNLVEMIQELYDLLDIEKEPPVDPVLFRTYAFGHYVGFSLEQEYQLLQLRDEETRQRFMIAHLQEMLKTQRSLDNLKKRAALNGHFKELDSPF